MGGAGIDYIYVDLSDTANAANFVFSNGNVAVNASTSFAQMEGLGFNGSTRGDKVTGSARGDILLGNEGNDTLVGGRGDDQFNDGAGNDRLLGGGGNDNFVRSDGDGTDLMDGGDGFDSLSFDFYSSLSAVVDLANGNRNDGIARGLTLRSIEAVHGSSQDDDIRGSGRAESLAGGGAGDLLNGRGGNDTLEGGAGADLLTGGSGADHFVFGYDAIGSGDDITDFTRGTDKLVLEGADFGFDSRADFNLVTGTSPSVTGGVPQFLFETASSRLWYDADGSGGDSEAVLMATLNDVHNLTKADFLIT